MGMLVLLSHSAYATSTLYLLIFLSEIGRPPSGVDLPRDDSLVETNGSHTANSQPLHYALDSTLKMTHESPVRLSRNRKSRSRGLRTTTGWYVLLLCTRNRLLY